MDKSIEAFHANCLAIWKCSNCPVCYLIKNPSLVKNSVCMKCGVKEGLWFCLTCGHVGCGRYVKRHAIEHYGETKHRHVVAVNGFQVYDYKTEKWLHNDNGDKEQKNSGSPKTSPKNPKNNCVCPVCHYEATPRLLRLPTCMKCKFNQLDQLWICLSCGHVGCGGLKNNHASHHHQATNHPQVVQMQNFSTYDYSQRKYLHMEVHDTEAIKSGNDEIDSHPNRNDTDVSTINESKLRNGNSTSNVNIDTVSTEDLSAASTLLQLQQEDLLNRLDCFELQVLDKLRETNKKVTTLEHVMLSLTTEEKMLEEKLDKDEKKLDECPTKVSGSHENNLPVVSLKAVEMEINGDVVRSTKTSALPKNLERPVTSAAAKSFNENQFIYLFILGLFGVCLIKFALLNLAESLMKSLYFK